MIWDNTLVKHGLFGMETLLNCILNENHVIQIKFSWKSLEIVLQNNK